MIIKAQKNIRIHSNKALSDSHKSNYSPNKNFKYPNKNKEIFKNRRRLNNSCSEFRSEEKLEKTKREESNSWNRNKNKMKSGHSSSSRRKTEIKEGSKINNQINSQIRE